METQKSVVKFLFATKALENCRGGFLPAIWVFPKIGIPQNGWFIMENPIKNGWFGGKPTIFGNTHIVSRIFDKHSCLNGLQGRPKVPVAHVDGLVPLLDPRPGESRHIPGKQERPRYTIKNQQMTIGWDHSKLLFFKLEKVPSKNKFVTNFTKKKSWLKIKWNMVSVPGTSHTHLIKHWLKWCQCWPQGPQYSWYYQILWFGLLVHVDVCGTSNLQCLYHLQSSSIHMWKFCQHPTNS